MTPITHVYQHDCNTVLALLTSVEFLTRRNQAMGDRDVHIALEPGDARVRLRSERIVERELPAFAKRLFSPASKVTQVEEWDVAARTGHYSVDIAGAPVTVSARMALVPHAGGCQFSITFDIDARVPLIRRKLEAFILEQTKARLARELAFTDAALAHG